MKFKNVLLFFFVLGFLWSCGKDDDPAPPKNTSPVIPAKTFTIPENIAPSTVIGTVTATDADKDALTFTITANDNNLFAITETGVLSLASGKSLSFDTKEQHVVTVAVSDGEASASALVTINVTKVNPENQAPEIAAQQFTVSERIDDVFEIGVVNATDPDLDDLDFGIVANDNDLFEISVAGELSLATGKQLDFDAAQEHMLTVAVSDGNSVSQADITIKVTEDIAPTGQPQEFEALENISDTNVIGSVVAEDPENQMLTFSIITNDNNLFQITEGGELRLADGMSLDFELATKHNIVVGVSDQFNEPVEIPVTIHVLDVLEALPNDPATSFVTTWETTVAGESITIGTSISEQYHYFIDWGDGEVEERTDKNPSHTYKTPGVYSVAIQGIFPAIRMVDLEDGLKLVSMEQWGSIVWKDFTYAFAGCKNMVYNATDAPDLSNVTSTTFTFYNCNAFDGDLNAWNTGNIQNMGGMFYQASSFNGNIGSWDVANVTDMNGMFYGADKFNQDLSNWDVSNVVWMQYMFYSTNDFNGNIGSWNVVNVKNMEAMFKNATSFDQSLATWNISNVENMQFMLDGSALSTTNINSTLISWSMPTQSYTPPFNIVFGTGGLVLCGTDVGTAAAELLGTYNWELVGGTYNPMCN